MTTPAVIAALLLAARATAQTTCSDACSGSALCVGDRVPRESAETSWDVCYPPGATAATVALDGALDGARDEDDGAHAIVVVSNYYAGCNAGRREASAFPYIAQRLHDAHPNVVFVSGLKGGTSCESWGANYESYAESQFGLDIETQPLTTYDEVHYTHAFAVFSSFPGGYFVVVFSRLRHAPAVFFSRRLLSPAAAQRASATTALTEQQPPANPNGVFSRGTRVRP